MSTKYYLQKVPVESVEPGYSLAIREPGRKGGKFRLFQVECTQQSQRSGQPVMITLTSQSDEAVEYEAGTPVVRLFGVCEAAAS
ncbi:hypothetical protein A5634_06070 [Mycobacterium asiaticum]|uniref:Uncharacterized protein n=1 Tax=Mycobacterium asiaticum TaxID=1790 RepID=A0A1A3NNZ7_MYCAS|nr:hypothetical protein [Mycobacterium asiaticum]OBK23080.1 hypothetical protein A5634_06070 [Mycobacterium asiaticum]